jgi:hypothetical protein
MEILNPTLYAQIKEKYGEVRVVNEGDPCTLSNGDVPSSFGAKKKLQCVSLEKWGETYLVCCDKCGDTRFRLAFGHRLGTSIQLPGKKSYATFSRRMFHCHNENCDVMKTVNSFSLPNDYAMNAITKTTVTEKKRNELLVKSVELVAPAYPLTDSEHVPDVVYEFLTKRKFDPNFLYEKFGIRYAPEGATWKKENQEDFTTWDKRLVIPVIQHLHQVGWQLRAVEGSEKRYKYVNSPGSQKQAWLYNFDRALLHQEVIIFEGITNVWRTGSDSIAVFGHIISSEQAFLMKAVWGYDGTAVLCFDEDVYADHGGDDDDIKYARLLKKAGSFPGGVAILRLRGGDAAEHTYERMRQLKAMAHKLATTDPNFPAILDENDVPPLREDIEVQHPRATSREVMRMVISENDTVDEEDETWE